MVDLQTLTGGSGTGWTLATPVASTSGTSIDFIGMSGAKEVAVLLSGVSTNGTSDLLIQIGDSGGIETSGYVGGSSLTISAGATQFSSSTAGFIIRDGNASNVYHGIVSLFLMDASAQTWVASAALVSSVNSFSVQVGGSKSLSPGPFDRVRITSVTPDTFDAGSINVAWR